MNSELLGMNGTLIRDGVEVTHYKNKPEDIRYIYDGHEVAAHSLTHPFLPDLPDDEIIRQVEQDRLNLSELVGYEVCGFAYPCSSPKNDPRTIEIVRQKTGVRYARTVETTMSFAPQKDLYFVQGSIYHHAQWDNLFEMGERFLAAEEGEFYIWGHSYSCASLLYANGVSLKEIQEWLGHSDITTTSNIYTHLDFSSKVSSANAILPAFPKNVQYVASWQ